MNCSLVDCYRTIKGTKSESKSQQMEVRNFSISNCYRTIKGTKSESKSQQKSYSHE